MSKKARKTEVAGLHESRPSSTEQFAMRPRSNSTVNPSMRSNSLHRKSVLLSSLTKIAEYPEKPPEIKLQELLDQIAQILSQEWTNSTLKIFESNLKEIYEIEDTYPEISIS